MKASTGRLERQRDGGVVTGEEIHRSPAGHEVSGRVGDGQHTCAHCGAPLIGRHPQTMYCSEACKRLEQLARGFQPVVLPGETLAEAEERSELADARRQLARLHARRAVLASDASDSMIGAELTSIASQIRAAEARLLEPPADGAEAGA
jgi:hypothetical protein